MGSKMIMDINCYMCNSELGKKGAVYLTPPVAKITKNVDVVHKFHFCHDCNATIGAFIEEERRKKGISKW